MTEKLTTPKAVLAFPNLREKKQINGQGKPTYSAVLIFDPANFTPFEREAFRKMKKAATSAIKEQFGSKAIEDEAKNRLKPGYHWPFRKAEEKEDYQGFDPKKIFISVKTQLDLSLGRIQMVGGKAQAKDVEYDDKLFYPGAIVRAKVSPWAYDNVTKGVKWNLDSLLFVTDGERLAGAAAASESFEDDDFSDLDLDAEIEDEDIGDDDDDYEDEDED